MNLSSELVSQFVKITKDNNPTKTESTLYGTIVTNGDSKYVQIDGSELLTPITTTTDVENGERVVVLLQNHTAIVTGNLSSPAARTDTVKEVNEKVENLSVVVADKVSTDELEAERARIKTLESDNVTVKEKLTANEADILELEANKISTTQLDAEKARIDKLESDNVTVKEKLTAHEADISDLKTDNATIKGKLTANEADIFNLKTSNVEIKGRLDANEANISDLKTDKLSTTDAEIKYANIDFANIGEAAIRKIFSDTGMISNLVVGEGTITGKLVGVTVSGDLIEGNTVKADKLVVLGDDGLYYKLNVNSLGEAAIGELSETEQNALRNGLHGSTIIAKSITAEKIKVTDLVAFGATIGGFNISNNSLYSGVKSSVNNTTKGIYLDNTGQIAFGDAYNFIKYYKDTDGTYKLAISAGVIELGGGRNVSDVINEAVDNVEIGGRNYLLNSLDEQYTDAETRAEFLKTTFDLAPFFDQNGLVEVTLSFDAYAPIAGDVQVYCQNGYESGSRYSFQKSVAFSTEWERYSVTFTPSGPNDDFEESFLAFYGVYDSGVIPHVRMLKLEKGNKATDWSSAPEDSDEKINAAQSSADAAQNSADAAQNSANTAQNSANTAQKTADNAQESANTAQKTAEEAKKAAEEAKGSITSAEVKINALEGKIVYYTVDEYGATKLTQTSEGWEFDLSAVEDELSKNKEYVHIIEDDGDPRIEVGKIDENGNGSKVVISDTDISLVSNGTDLAKVEQDPDTNDSRLYIKKAYIDNELRIGNFVFEERENGNVGIVWKGVSQ